MTEEYVDVLGEKYTKMWKIIAYIRFFVKLFWCFIVCASLIIVCIGLEPYINGTQEWEYAPFTLSQLNAIFCLIVWCLMCSKAIKVI